MGENIEILIESTEQDIEILGIGVPGQPGDDATINGVNVLEIIAGDNINIVQEDDTLTISADQPTALSELSDDATHRLTTDTEKASWDAKQVAGDYATIADLPTDLSELSDDATHRLVTDTEKSTWSAKQPAGSYELTTNKGENNGYAELDAGGKVPLSRLPSTLLVYKGVWNALTNTPALLAIDVTKKGFVYNVSVAGTQFGIAFSLGDWAIYNDSGAIEKSDNSDDVVSVNGQQGAVSLDTDDIADTADNRYTNDTDISRLADTSGENTGDQTLPTTLAELSDDSTHRLVTDTEKSTWNGKQNAMGSDDNYVTDAEKVVLSNTSGINSGDNSTNLSYERFTYFV